MGVREYLHKRKIKKVAGRVSSMFPKFLLILAKGLSGKERVADVVAHNAAVLGFMYGYARLMVLVSEQKHGFDRQALNEVVYLGIASAFNRPEDVQQLRDIIVGYQDAGDIEFKQHEDLGSRYLSSTLGMVVSDHVEHERNIVHIRPLMSEKVYVILREHNLLPELSA